MIREKNELFVRITYKWHFGILGLKGINFVSPDNMDMGWDRASLKENKYSFYLKKGIKVCWTS